MEGTFFFFFDRKSEITQRTRSESVEIFWGEKLDFDAQQKKIRAAQRNFIES